MFDFLLRYLKATDVTCLIERDLLLKLASRLVVFPHNNYYIDLDFERVPRY